MPNPIGAVVQAAELATARQAAAAELARNAASVGNIAQGVTAPAVPAAVSGRPGAAEGQSGG